LDQPNSACSSTWISRNWQIAKLVTSSVEYWGAGQA